jgi:hypothetical protein
MQVTETIIATTEIAAFCIIGPPFGCFAIGREVCGKLSPKTLPPPQELPSGAVCQRVPHFCLIKPLLVWDREWGLWFWDHFTHLCADGSVYIADHTGPCLGEVVTFKELLLPYIAKVKKSTLSGSRNPFSCERLLLSAVAAHNGFEERELFEFSS